MASSRPSYARIKEYLLSEIESGAYVAGDRIPAENALATQFGVSRMTANKAIRDLVQKGLLVRRVGSGTFVSQRKSESSLFDIRNIADEIRLRGGEHSSQIIALKEVAASEEVAVFLGVRTGTRVFYSEIVHRENGVAIQLERRHVNPKLAPDYLQQDFERQTPNAILVARYPVTDVENSVEAMLPSDEEAALLEMSPSDACLLVVRRTWSGELLISYTQLLHPGKRYKLNASRNT
ncbi:MULTISPECIES: histidine utilization repressor [Halomonas]|jgi:GntR family histidine utilization transcriptional repressor|uniref:Histidine utilization repressor n=1 Tax=Halomonas litopenaei TaxID=2109328 RepID=A0ABX5ISL6_9GAMM|nr:MULTISPECIES: histidine utilization repressor [Halomonas]MBR9882024.1 histidine utilization repressor [Gammaproteobacteria bacterium]MAR73422.1 histidine utilization repressor [Halomonas sp.]MBS8271235.1 histidine utilization repressor [Halomonas litopenaei]MCJ8287916.1 histidine utilization repressor [Halomonas sp.]MCO7214778.1 histidine utilization repressor [Halomonas sp. OfavH-34-E]|tara:strand:+ start:2970 stop:3677 length:708 start_codon:yes stop_codon:yes gene_type:complete